MHYYVYHNKRYGRAIIHLESCRFCPKGVARTLEDSARYLEWYGPFETLTHAALMAQATQEPRVQSCKHCLRKPSWRQRCQS
jgi:hypothetical protein